MVSIEALLSVITMGVGSGLLTGLTGLSGMGLILMFISLFHIIADYKTIVGTMVYVLTFPTTITAVYVYYKQNKINFLVGNILIITSLIGAYIGSNLAVSSKYNLSDKTIKYITGVFALVVGFYFLISAYFMKGATAN